MPVASQFARLASLLVAASVAGVGALPGTAAASFGEPSPQQAVPATDGAIDSIARFGDTTYIGGRFTMVGTPTGSGVGASTATGANLDFPRIEGLVTSTVPDGSGGFYVGGQFERVGGVLRSNLAHIRADGTLNPNYAPDPDQNVTALARSDDGSRLYVAGAFTTIGGRARNAVAALDASGEALAAFDMGAAPNGAVTTLAVRAGSFDRHALYVGGTFTSIGGQTRNRVAALGDDGVVDPGWSVNANGDVRAILTDTQGRVVLGGGFTSIAASADNGATRHFVAVSHVDGQLVPGFRNGNTNGAVNTITTAGQNHLYIGGQFTRVQDQPQTFLARVASDGGYDATSPPADGEVNSLATATDGTVYAGGSFKTVGGLSRLRIAAIDPAALTVVPGFAPNVDGPVRALAVAGSTVYAGGSFKLFGSVVRNQAAAFTTSTGAVTDFNPNVAGTAFDGVRGLAVSPEGDTVFLGGAFDTVGGTSRPKLAAVSAATGALRTGFNASPDIPVFTLATGPDGTLYAGGGFSQIGGQRRNRVAALDPLTGLAKPFNPPLYSNFYPAIAYDAGKLYLGGTTMTAVDATTAEFAGSWSLPGLNPQVSAIAVDAGTLFVGGIFAGPNKLVAFEKTSNTPKAGFTAPTLDNVVNSLARSGSRLYVGGRFDVANNRARNGLLSLDATSGALDGFAPDTEGGGVLALDVSGSTVLAGGDFQKVGLENRQSLARFVDPGNLAVGPRAPIDLRTDPVSPGRVTGPKVRGLAEDGSTVRVYTTATCTGTPVATGTALTFEQQGLAVSVSTPNGATVSFRATATDAANATSPCSQPVDYVVDTAAPSATITTPADGTRYFQNARVLADFTCQDTAGGSGIRFCDPTVADGRPVDTATPGTKSFTVRATDRAGNAGPATTVTYTVEPTPPLVFSAATFLAAPGTSTQVIATGDFDAGTDPDLVAPDTASGNGVSGFARVLLGAQGATFAAPTQTPVDFGPESVAVADMNRDGFDDFVTGNAFGSISVARGRGDGTFLAPLNASTNPPPNQQSGIYDLAVADFDGDTHLDVVAIDERLDTGFVLRGDGTGALGAPVVIDTGVRPQSVAVGNFDGDPDPDLAIASTLGVSIHRGGGPGATFLARTPVDIGNVNPRNVDVGDFDDDGQDDLAVGAGGVVVVRGLGNGAFAAPVLEAPEIGLSQTTTPADLNGDGDLDLIAVGFRENQRVTVLVGGAGTTFDVAHSALLQGPALDAAVADFNSDGDLDFAIANGGQNAVEPRLQESGISIFLGLSTPGVPTGLASSPASPARDTTPQISGVARPGSTVRLYATADCSGTPVAMGTAEQFASPGLTVTVASPSTTTFKATAGTLGGTSACSTSSVTYEDLGPRATAVTRAASSIGQSAAALNGTFTPTDGSTSVFFEYGTTTAYGRSTPPVQVTSGSSGERSATVFDLTPGTSYVYRAVATQAGLPPVVGAAVAFTTNASGGTPPPPDPPPTNSAPPPTNNAPPPTFTQPPPTFTQPPPTFLQPPPGPGGPSSIDEAPLASSSSSAISAALLRSLRPAGRGAKIAAIVKAKGYRAPFVAPTAGKLSVAWSARSVVMATVTKSVPRGSSSVLVKLTPKGRTAFAKAKRTRKALKLTAKGAFTPAGGAKVSKTLGITLKP